MPKFIVVRVEGRKETRANKKVYASADDAQLIANDLMKIHHGYKFQIRPVVEEDNNWQEREEKRFKDGSYVPVPWAKCRWVKKAKECVEHFVHVSQDDPTQIAYTAEPAKGKLDKQTRMSPSKYLARYYDKHITEKIKRKWLAIYKKLHGSDFELKLAFSGEDIKRVYKDGPSSCMKGVKAVEAYEGPDLAVAYIERKGKITARTVVWPEKKLYCDYVYGDREFIREVLEEEGYKSSARFKGAKMSYNGGNLPSIEMAREGLCYPKTRENDTEYLIIR